MVTASPIRCFSRSVNSRRLVGFAQILQHPCAAVRHVGPVLLLGYYDQSGRNSLPRAERRRRCGCQGPPETASWGEPVRITWPLRGWSPNLASRPASQRSDSMGGRRRRHLTVPTTTSLMRTLRLRASSPRPKTCFRFCEHESRVNAAAHDQPLAGRPGAGKDIVVQLDHRKNLGRWPPDTPPPTRG